MFETKRSQASETPSTTEKVTGERSRKVKSSDSADQHFSTDKKTLMLTCTTWWRGLLDIKITWFFMNVAVTGKGNPFLLGEAKWFVSLSRFAFGVIELLVWFWYPAQCKADIKSPFQLRSGLLQLLLRSDFLSPTAPSWQHSLHQQPGKPTDASSGFECPLQKKA